MTTEYAQTCGHSGPTKASPRLAVVILNWNGWRDTIECLASIYRSRLPHDWQVVVVDNGSTDESIERIQQWADGNIAVSSKLFESDHREESISCTILDSKEAEVCDKPREEDCTSPPDAGSHNPRLIVIRVPENSGYAGGNNVGIRFALRCGYEYIGLLNNDTVVDQGMLEQILNCLDQDAGIGIVGAKTFYYDAPNTLWNAGADLDLFQGTAPIRGMGHQDGPEFSGVRQTDVVGGHALFARREVFERVGLLDEDFFLIWEDTEICIRTTRRTSFRVCINLDARLWHKGGGISSSGLVSPAATYFANRNRLKTVWRYGTRAQRIGFLFYYLASRVPKFALLILKGQFSLVRAECTALADFLVSRPCRATHSSSSKPAKEKLAKT